MPGDDVNKELNRGLATVRGENIEDIQQNTPERLRQIAEAVMTSAHGSSDGIDHALYGELVSLALYIQRTKEELANLRAAEISGRHIPSATDELDVVVGATEEATNTIMDQMEALEKLGAELPREAADKIGMVVTEVYQACSFQDITGQRITKVVNTLKHIDSKVDVLLSSLGDKKKRVQEARPSSEADLLNGPQLPGKGIDQSDVDKLFGGD